MTAAERGPAGQWHWLGLWAGDTIDLAQTRAALPGNDIDAARLLSRWRPGWFHHVPPDRTWYVWDGRCHRPDASALVQREVMAFADALAVVLQRCRQQLRAEIVLANPGAAAAAIDREAASRWKAEWEYLAKYTARLRTSAGLAAVSVVLAGVCGTTPEAMADAWPQHLNTASGIVDLLGEPGPGLHTHDPRAMMTYCLDVPYEAGADCPEFRGLLWRAVNGNQEVYEHLIAVLGYCLLGANPLQLVFFLSGPTNSGKSALLEVVSTVLGTLAYDAKPALIGSTRRDRGERHARHEATMRGKRLITIAETNDQIYIDEVQLKSLTGQRRVAVELLYSREMTFTQVSFTIVVANNDMPSVAHLDGALRRRLRVLPMGDTIPVEERDQGKVDRIVEREAAGVLALLVRGCREAMANNGQALLLPPAAVVAKTQEYEHNQDTCARWLAERCVAANGSTAAVHGPDALNAYFAWCQAGDLIPLGRNHFYDQLGMQPGVWKTSGGAGEHVYFKGFVIKETWS